MLDGLIDRFRSSFGAGPSAAARAPGRVNLIGEHTDYNGGLVLPCALELETWAVVRERSDGRVRLVSDHLAAQLPTGFDARAPQRTGSWSDYVAGVVWALRARGFALAGFDLALASTVPVGAGLSSSAALAVAVATALDALFDLGLSARERAHVAHEGENAFVGVRCGILDPFASALCERGAALRIDCRDESIRSVPLPAERVALLISDSGVPRALAASGYNRRVEECATALAVARDVGLAPAHAATLRDLDPAALPDLAGRLPEASFRRVRHVLSENARVDACAQALAAGALDRAGVLLREGHRSLRDDYEVSLPELDLLCALGDACPGVYGSRLTGAGFGGCVLHLVAPDAADEAAAAIADGFARRFGRRPRSWIARTGAAAAAVSL